MIDGCLNSAPEVSPSIVTPAMIADGGYRFEVFGPQEGPFGKARKRVSTVISRAKIVFAVTEASIRLLDIQWSLVAL